MSAPADSPRGGGGRRRKILFVAEQFAPPVVDGSTYVYKNWIDFLAERSELHAIFFRSYDGEPTQAHAYLAERCKAHLILPGAPASRVWKAARAGVRFVTGRLFAPRWLEELGRADIHRAVADFVARHEPDLVLVSKLVSVPLLGEANIRALRVPVVLDMHDDFVQRDGLERRVLARLLSRFPEMADYPTFRNMRFRQRLSRLDPVGARGQEARLCGLFDRVLASSAEEHAFYRSNLAAAPCDYLGWPPPLRSVAEESGAGAAAPAPRFDAGFIGGNHPFNVEALAYFLDEILPRIRSRRPEFSVLVAGKVGAPFALGSRSWHGVEFLGYVADARSFYEQVRMSVVPILSGTGVSLKTLEALDYGRPVIATKGGVRGLVGIERHPGLLLADRPEDFAERVLSVLAAPGSASPALSRAGNAPEDARADFAVRFERLLLSLGRRADGRPAAAARFRRAQPAPPRSAARAPVAD